MSRASQRGRGGRPGFAEPGPAREETGEYKPVAVVAEARTYRYSDPLEWRSVSRSLRGTWQIHRQSRLAARGRHRRPGRARMFEGGGVNGCR